MHVINDPQRSPAQRLDALRVAARDETFPDWVVESNNHIHTCYSFSPYTPAGAALGARRAGLRVVGSVDHDSIAAADEMTRATRILGMGSVTGFECRAFFGEGFEDRKLNNPDFKGIAYMTVQGVPAQSRQQVEQWLAPRRAARLERTLAMAKAANDILASLGLAPFDAEADMVARSQYHEGGGITERHLLAAMADALIAGFGRGEALLTGLKGMGITVPAKLAGILGDVDNPHLTFDLLGVLKAEYLDRIYIQPTTECPSAVEVVELADSVGAIATYAYLGDVSASPTGDKKAEKFEDEFLDELFAGMVERGLRAVTYMPPRNTAEQIERIHQLSVQHGMLEISGVDINTPRQVFTCPELRDPKLAELNEATWALVAHEALASVDPSVHLLGEGRLSPEQLAERIKVFAPLGREYADGAEACDLLSRIN
ncbi:MAG: PHP domain-containing protein [Propionibacteriaceae bacterium]|nr:PHP domain-containing protein [Propionibacteriaceae bacterium]